MHAHLLLQAAQLLPLQLQAEPSGLYPFPGCRSGRLAPPDLCAQVPGSRQLALHIIDRTAQSVGHEVRLVLCICHPCPGRAVGCVQCRDASLLLLDGLLGGVPCRAGGGADTGRAL